MMILKVVLAKTDRVHGAAARGAKRGLTGAAEHNDT